VYKRLVPFGTVMLFGTIPPRDRELLILRTADRCGCVYEQTHHEHIAVERGVEAAEIEAVHRGPDDPGWSPFDAALLRAVDELHDHQRISDATWQTIAERYEQSQMIELPILIGHYHLMAFTLNSLGVQLEPEYR
jgi:AhpD family alkylhydroperoxidase